MEETPQEAQPQTGFKSVIRNGLIAFIVLLVILAIVAYFMDDTFLPMEYEGFD